MFSFFFCKQKTAYEMRISDWSSDVCSSDLACKSRMTLNCREGSGIFGKRRSQLCGPGFARSSASIAEEIAKECGRFGFGDARIDVRPVMAGGLGVDARAVLHSPALRSEEHTSELQSLMRISYAVFCLKKKK